MIFKVKRTSLCDRDRSPCEEAQAVMRTEVIPGHEPRVVGIAYWTIRIDTIDELLEFAEKYNKELVLSLCDGDLATIEIYDYYRE